MRLVLIFCLLLFSLIAPLLSGEIPAIDLYVSGTLASQSTDYSFSFPVELSVIDQELYVLDQKSNIINVFDSDRMSFIHRFGGYGSEPGLFNRVFSLSPDSWGNLAISDFNNNRIQFFSLAGDYQSEFEVNSPWKFCFYDQELYIDVFPGSDDAGIYHVTATGIFPEVDLAKYFLKNNFGSILDKYYTYCVTDWGYVVSFSGRDEIIFFNNSGKAKRTKVDKLPLKYENTLYGKPIAYQDGFLILATSNDHQMTDSLQTSINYHSLIGKYNKNGKLITLYNLPPNVWLSDSWALSEQQIFLYDSIELKVYKFNLD